MSNSKSFVTKLKDLKNTSSPEAQPAPAQTDASSPWFDDESYDGQLAVDVFQNEKDIVIKSTIAGVKPEDIDISINNDMVTIKGVRRHDEQVTEENYFYRECYWGGFSRSIILPVDIVEDRVTAQLKNGVLTVTLPKAGKAKVQTVAVESLDDEDA